MVSERAGTAGAYRRGMNEVFFGVKRAHHSCLRVSRTLLGAMITPARFDMMFALGTSEGRYGALLQKELCVMLGVSDATVSRMVTALQRLGWVEREPDDVDGRRRWVVLTAAGRRLLVCLRARFLGQREDAQRLNAALGAPRPEEASRNRRGLRSPRTTSWPAPGRAAETRGASRSRSFVVATISRRCSSRARRGRR
jgi:DNA-binding MarR family transcriptional regulator